MALSKVPNPNQAVYVSSKFDTKGVIVGEYLSTTEDEDGNKDISILVGLKTQTYDENDCFLSFESALKAGVSVAEAAEQAAIKKLDRFKVRKNAQTPVAA
jgi:hypothetical protein